MKLLGNNIVSYYLGTMLTNAGITDHTEQLKIVSCMNYLSDQELTCR